MKETRPAGPLAPPLYNSDGDLIDAFFEDRGVNYYGEWLGPHLTVYRAQDDGRIVGFQVGGVKELIEKGLATGDAAEPDPEFDESMREAGWRKLPSGDWEIDALRPPGI
jgi:hypothetical protein